MLSKFSNVFDGCVTAFREELSESHIVDIRDHRSWDSHRRRIDIDGCSKRQCADIRFQCQETRPGEPFDEEQFTGHYYRRIGRPIRMLFAK